MQIQRPSSATLCPQCTNLVPLLIDISPTSKPGNAHTNWWEQTYNKVKSIQGLVPENCELCRILKTAFTRVAGFSTTETKINISHRTLARYKGLEHNACVIDACGTRLTFAPVLPVVKIDDGEDVLGFTGRIVPPLINSLVARNWMRRCEKHHDACRLNHSSKDFDFPFRLIDVRKECLVKAPLGARYVALSYVWGSVKQVVLNKTTWDFLHLEGIITINGLREPDERYTHLRRELAGRVIPYTIRDALLLCSMLNERYLWIDSLCILQDDDFKQSNEAWTNEDKLAQIPKMDIIYGASVLTVIAASGTDSNAGLPGVHISSTRKKQVVGNIGDQTFVSITEDPLDAFWRSKWSERAWTFQEFLLSKRHLLFLPEQIVFHCSTLSWSEDHSLEYLDVPGIAKEGPVWTNSYKLRPLKLPEASKLTQEFVPAGFINDYYCLWLRNFLKRQLTVTSDILFAFDGMLSASNSHLGSFHHGLPVDYFCESLHWLVGTDSSNVSNSRQPRQGLTQRRESFPSWSWTGWMWNVASYEEFTTHYQTKTPKNWCRVGIWGIKTSVFENVELWKITSPDVKAWQRLDCFPAGAFEVGNDLVNCYLPIVLETIKKSPLPSNHLVIKTVMASIFISTQRDSEWTAALKSYSSPSFTPENSIGVINFPQNWHHKIGDKKSMQIIVTGNYFYGPDPRWPERTDEMDPMIDCLVVEAVGNHGELERLTSFVSRFSQLKKLEWRTVVAILR
jgi:heterokaryon incompatibility protein (HET)